MRVGKESLQGGNTLGGGAVQIDLLGFQGSVNGHFLAGAGDGNIQPSPAAIPVQRTEIHINLAVFVRAVADGEEDHIPLVTLDIFQVLDEQRFFGLESPGFQIGIFPAGVAEQVIDEMLLIDVKGDDTNALIAQKRIVASTLEFGNDSLGFCPVLPLFAPFKDTVHMDKADLAFTVVDRGESVELTFIETGVRIGDEAFVAAAVVPQQVSLGHVQSQAIVQNAFQIFHIQIFFVYGVGGEEGGGRHLLGVTYDHRIATPGQNTHGLAGRKLGGFVKDNQIKVLLLGIQILGGGNGAHEHTRT